MLISIIYTQENRFNQKIDFKTNFWSPTQPFKQAPKNLQKTVYKKVINIINRDKQITKKLFKNKCLAIFPVYNFSTSPKKIIPLLRTTQIIQENILN